MFLQEQKIVKKSSARRRNGARAKSISDNMTSSHIICDMHRQVPRLNRVPTMYSLIHGGQGPHTIPFAILHRFCFKCSAQELRNLVLTPHQFECVMKSEGVTDYEIDLQTYCKIYKAFLKAIRENKEDREAIYREWGGYGWRQLGERLLNLNPYATYHWQTGVSPSSQQGHKMLAGKGEQRFSTEYRKKGILSVDDAVNMIDGKNASENEFEHQNAFREHLIKILRYCVDEEQRECLEKKIREKVGSDVFRAEE